MFIRVKVINKKNYYYLVENKWQDGTCKQKVIRYLGKTKPSAQLLQEVLKPSA